MPLLPNMRFRVFLNRSTTKMWAFGYHWDNSVWIEMWGDIDEPSPYNYRFFDSLERMGYIRESVEYALADGFLEVLTPAHIANWDLVYNEDHTLTLVPIASDQVIETQVPGIVPTDDAAIEAAGYRRIGI